MGQSSNELKCNDCKEEFYVVIEWLSKKEAIEKIEETRCPACDSENWYFTDVMGQ